jgi:hypothetical protein
MKVMMTSLFATLGTSRLKDIEFRNHELDILNYPQAR